MVGATIIGTATIKASALCFNNGVRDWFTFEYKGKSCGQVMFETKFTPAGGAKAAAGGAASHMLPATAAVGVSYMPVGAPVIYQQQPQYPQMQPPPAYPPAGYPPAGYPPQPYP